MKKSAAQKSILATLAEDTNEDVNAALAASDTETGFVDDSADATGDDDANEETTWDTTPSPGLTEEELDARFFSPSEETTPEPTPAVEETPPAGLCITQESLLALLAQARNDASQYWVVSYYAPDMSVTLIARYAFNQYPDAVKQKDTLTPQAEGTDGEFRVVAATDEPGRKLGMMAGEKTLSGMMESYRQHKNTRYRIFFTSPDGTDTLVGEWGVSEKSTAWEKLVELRPLASKAGKFWLGAYRGGVLVSGEKKETSTRAASSSLPDDEKEADRIIRKRASAALWRINVGRIADGLPKYSSLEEAILAGVVTSVVVPKAQARVQANVSTVETAPLETTDSSLGDVDRFTEEVIAAD